MTANGYLNKKEIEYVIDDALELFNKKFNTDYSRENIHFGFFNNRTFREVYERFCTRYFPLWLREDYENPEFYIYTQASTFVEGSEYGILINYTVKCNYGRWLCVILHELGHIHATTKEYNGNSFYRAFCEDDSPVENSRVMYDGYAMWREFIAEYLAQVALQEFDSVFLDECVEKIVQWEYDVTGTDSISLKGISMILATILTTIDYQEISDWDSFAKRLGEIGWENYTLYLELIRLVYLRLKKLADKPYALHEDFVYEIGCHVNDIAQVKQISGFLHQQ